MQKPLGVGGEVGGGTAPVVSLRESGQLLKAGLHSGGSQAPPASQFRLAGLSVGSWCWGLRGVVQSIQAEKSLSHWTEFPFGTHRS